jgi:hypothetical protein
MKKRRFSKKFSADILGNFRNNVAAKNPVRPRKNTAEGWFGGNSAMPERNQTEASPTTLQFIARHHRKILFSLGEKEIRRAQIRKSEENFFVGWRVVASGGGAASLVGIRLVKSSDFVQEGQPYCMNWKG